MGVQGHGKVTLQPHRGGTCAYSSCGQVVPPNTLNVCLTIEEVALPLHPYMAIRVPSCQARYLGGGHPVPDRCPKMFKDMEKNQTLVCYKYPKFIL